MSLYSREEKEAHETRASAAVWFKNGLLTVAEKDALIASAPVRMPEPNLFFRILYATFTGIGVIGTILFANVVIQPHGAHQYSAMNAALGVLCLTLAIGLGRRGAHRYGAEEVLAAAGACFLLGAMSHLLFQNHHRWMHDREEMMWFAGMGALLAGGLFWTFGRLLFGILAIGFLGVFPFLFRFPEAAQRTILALGLFLGFILLQNDPSPWAFERRRNFLLEAMLFLGAYLTINVRLESLPSLMGLRATARVFDPAWLYWITYALCFAVPAAGIWYALRERKQPLLAAALVAALLTIMTNKAYLGLTRYAWDGIILGVALIGAAVAVLRFLRRRENDSEGITSKNLLKRDGGGLDLAALLAPLPHRAGFSTAPTGHDAPPPDLGQGGQSGGGGANRGF